MIRMSTSAAALLASVLLISCERSVPSDSAPRVELEDCLDFLGIRVWQVSLSAEEAASAATATVFFERSGEDAVEIAQLLIGRNAKGPGVLQVFVQDEETSGMLRIMVRFDAGTSSFSSGDAIKSPFTPGWAGPSGIGMGNRSPRFDEPQLLMASGEAGVSTDFDDPKNREKLYYVLSGQGER